MANVTHGESGQFVHCNFAGCWLEPAWGAVKREGDVVMTTLVSEIPFAVQHQPRQVEETAPNAESRITMPKGEQNES